MKGYTVTIANANDTTTRQIVVEGTDVYLAHKHAIMQECDLSEDVVRITDSDDTEVFTLELGFNTK